MLTGSSSSSVRTASSRGTTARMAAIKVLVAEDDGPIRQLLVHHLERDGFVALEAADGPAALRLARSGADLALLDIGLPGIDGYDIVRTLRREGRVTPVVLVTARVEEVDRVVGFELGADDYVIKPFSPREVVARVRAILRRSGMRYEPAPTVMRFGRLEIDEAAREARVDGNDVGLKPREYALLVMLASNRASHYLATSCSSACGASTSTATSARSTYTSGGCGCGSRNSTVWARVCIPCTASATSSPRLPYSQRARYANAHRRAGWRRVGQPRAVARSAHA